MRASLTHADRSGHPREMFAARWILADAYALGPTPVPDCIERCKEFLSAHGIEVPGVRMALGVFAAMAGRFDEARAMHDQARQAIEEQMRVKRLLKFVAVSRAMVELMASDLDAAERELRSSFEIDRAIGEEREDFSQTAARLAFVLWRLGRIEEAEDLAAVSAEAAPSESVAARALSSAARARATVDVELARTAVHLVPEEMPNLRGDVLVELASVLRVRGDEEGAHEALDQAARLYERKGNVAAMALISL